MIRKSVEELRAANRERQARWRGKHKWLAQQRKLAIYGKAEAQKEGSFGEVVVPRDNGANEEEIKYIYGPEEGVDIPYRPGAAGHGAGADVKRSTCTGECGEGGGSEGAVGTDIDLGQSVPEEARRALFESLRADPANCCVRVKGVVVPGFE
jgi:hypothetical protein